MSERTAVRPLPAEATGLAPGRGRLTGRRLLVVGAGSRHWPTEDELPVGNGRAISLLGAREGASVVCADIDREAAEETCTAIRDDGGTAHVLVADVTDPQACSSLVPAAAELLGGLDALVANVGAGAGRDLAGTSAADWDLTFALNVRSHFLLAQAALPVFAAAGGAMVLMGSIGGQRPGSGIPAYDASKAALGGLVRHAAAEGAPLGVRVNLLVPGLIDTPLGRLATMLRPGRETAPVPLGRQGSAWEIAYAAVWLLSAESSYVTGQQLVVDGGLSLA